MGEDRGIDNSRLRTVPAVLVERYLDEGWWTDDSLGDLVATGLAEMSDAAFVVHSDVRPWRGTIGEVEQAARAFAGSLQARGIGPGDIVVFQLPNWVEAAITFWGVALAGAVVVPVVHFYGAKELGYILGVTQPAMVITADRFGQNDYTANYAELIGSLGAPWAIVGTHGADLPDGAIPFESLLDGPPLDQPVAVDPDAPAIIAFTSGTTAIRRGSSTPTARSVSKLASSAPCPPAADHPSSPAHPSATSSACSTRSSARSSATTPST